MKQVTIEYCQPCGYKTKAESAALALKASLNLPSELKPGRGGVFKVHVDGRLVIQRQRGQFPTPEDIVEAVRAAATLAPSS